MDFKQGNRANEEDQGTRTSVSARELIWDRTREGNAPAHGETPGIAEETESTRSTCAAERETGGLCRYHQAPKAGLGDK